MKKLYTLICVWVIIILTQVNAVAEYNNFEDIEDADVVIVTHEIFRTANWQPGMDGAWETVLLDQKVGQGYSVAILEIADGDDQDDIKNALEAGSGSFQFVYIIGMAQRPCSDADDNPGNQNFVLEYAADVVTNPVPIYRELVENHRVFGTFVAENDYSYVENIEGVSIGRIPIESSQEILDYLYKANDYLGVQQNCAFSQRILFAADNLRCGYNGCSAASANAWLTAARHVLPYYITKCKNL